MPQVNRRGFLKRLATGLASAALAGHLILRELVPVMPEVLPDPVTYRFDVLTGWSCLRPDFAVRILD